MNLSKWTAVALAALLSNACGGSAPGRELGNDEAGNDRATIDEAGSPESGESSNLVNGKPAEEYFEQFLYREEGGELADYRYLYNMDAVFLKDTPEQGTYATIRLALKEDRTFLLEYEEVVRIGVNSFSGAIETRDAETRRVTGQWSVEGTELVVGTWGRAHGAKVDGSDSAMLWLHKPIVSPEAADKTFMLKYVYSTYELE